VSFFFFVSSLDGPLLNGSSTFMFESTPVYPDEGRYWDMVQRHKITQLYTAPTAIRLLMRYGDEAPKKYDLSSVKVLGTVGEPINPEAWRWYYEVVGNSKCTVVDTYWQTETGGHIITNLPGVTPMKPGSCTFPFYGIDAVVLDAQDGHLLTEADEHGNFEGVMAIRQPWPGMARTCLGDHERYLNVYFKPYPGYYFTGDTVSRDKDGYHFIIGRMDDVSKSTQFVSNLFHETCPSLLFFSQFVVLLCTFEFQSMLVVIALVRPRLKVRWLGIRRWHKQPWLESLTISRVNQFVPFAC
jgi:acyl-coenzyme A synthetase/AMP-(fatty) acid ligase